MSKVRVSSSVQNARRRVQLICNDESLAHQSFKDECDMNNIIHKYRRTGVLTHVTSMVGSYGDFTDIPDYHSAMNVVAQAQQDFDQLPAVVRKRFANDPAQFMDFVHDPSNLEEMRSLGLVEPKFVEPNIVPLPASEPVLS